MKRLINASLLLAAVLGLALLGTSCGKEQKEEKPKTVAVTSVSVSPTSLNLTVGQTTSLTCSVLPADATNKSVTYSSSNEGVAAVDNSGRVTAVAPGSATITVKTADGGKTATCAVTVTAASVAVTGVTLDKKTLEMTEGDEATLTATVAPENATDKAVTWSSSDDKVAKVADGKVTAVAAGTATITVTTKDGGKTATCAVTVAAKTIAVTGVTLDPTELTLDVGDEATLTATVAPENATDKTVTWSSSDESVATVADGKVTAVAAGTATITVTTKDGGKTATCAVTVKSPVAPVTTATWLLSVDAMGGYGPTFTGLDEPNDPDGSYLGAPDASAGDHGRYIESQEKNARFTFVNSDKVELDADGKCANNVGKTGEPYVTGVWPGDYWLFTLKSPEERPAGSKIKLTASFRASGTGIKFWVVEVLDGNEWVPAFELKSGNDGVDDLQYNIELMNTTALVVDFSYTTKNAMKDAKVRFRALSLACANGKDRLTLPNGGTIRFKGAGASPVMSFGEE